MKRYKSFLEAIDDGLIKDYGTIIFWGAPGSGKSSLMTMACVDFMQPTAAQWRIELSESLCEKLSAAGFSIKPPSDHTVFVDTFAQSLAKNGHIEQTAYEIKLKDFAVPTNVFKPALICPAGVYAFDETQKELDSHNGSLPVHTSAAFEFARHVGVLIMLAMQRPIRAPKDVRDLATFIEVIDKNFVCNEYGVVEKSVWRCNVIYKNSVLEQYLNSNDANLVNKTVEFEFAGDIRECYDGNYFLPMFFKGLEEEILVLKKCENVKFTKESFKHYYEQHSIEEKEEERAKSGRDRKSNEKK